MMTPEDIQTDLVRMDYNDPEIQEAYERLRAKHKKKGLPYRELLMSRLFGTVKYLLVELHDRHGTVLITDMDNDNTYRFVDRNERYEESTREKIKNWIARPMIAA